MSNCDLTRFYWSDRYSISDGDPKIAFEEGMIRHLDDFFWKCCWFLKMGHIDGDYLEFGSGSNVRSFRLAFKHKRLENMSFRLFSFDSFQGLPEPEDLDIHPQWRKGAMAVSIDEFRALLSQQGAKKHDYQIVPGFYNDTLDNHSPSEYGIKKASFVFVDCDLFASTVSVLNFVKDVLIDGSILAFDDWFCFGGNPDLGEQRAFYEFINANPSLRLVEFQDFGWHGRSFVVHKKDSRLSNVTNI